MGKGLGSFIVFVASVAGLAGGLALGFFLSDVLHDTVEPRALSTFRSDFGAETFVDMPPVDGQVLGGSFNVWYSLREGGLAVSSGGGLDAPEYNMNYRAMGYEPDLVAIARDFDVMPETILDRTRVQRPRDIDDAGHITIPGAARFDAEMLGVDNAHFRGRLASVAGLWHWWGVTDTHLVLARSSQPFATTFESWRLDDGASVRAITAVRAPEAEGSVPANDDVWLRYADGRIVLLKDNQPIRTLALPEDVVEVDNWAAMPGGALLMVAEGQIWRLGADADSWQIVPALDGARGEARWLGHMIGRDTAWAHVGYDEAFWRITPQGEAFGRTAYAEIGIENLEAVAENQNNANPAETHVYVAGDGQVRREQDGEWIHWYDYDGEVLDYAIVEGFMTSMALDGDGPNARFMSLVSVILGAVAVFGLTWSAHALAVRVVRRLRDESGPIERENLISVGAAFGLPLFALTLLGFIVVFGTDAGDRAADLMRWYSTQAIVVYPNAHDDFITFWWTLFWIGGGILYALPGMLFMYTRVKREARPVARRQLRNNIIVGGLVLLWMLFEWLAADFGGVWEIVDAAYLGAAILFILFLVRAASNQEAAPSPTNEDTQKAVTPNN